MNIAVLSLVALSGLIMLISKKQKPVNGDMSATEVEYIEDKDDPDAGFVDFSGGTLGI